MYLLWEYQVSRFEIDLPNNQIYHQLFNYISPIDFKQVWYSLVKIILLGEKKKVEELVKNHQDCDQLQYLHSILILIIVITFAIKIKNQNKFEHRRLYLSVIVKSKQNQTNFICLQINADETVQKQIKINQYIWNRVNQLLSIIEAKLTKRERQGQFLLSFQQKIRWKCCEYPSTIYINTKNNKCKMINCIRGEQVAGICLNQYLSLLQILQRDIKKQFLSLNYFIDVFYQQLIIIIQKRVLDQGLFSIIDSSLIFVIFQNDNYQIKVLEQNKMIYYQNNQKTIYQDFGFSTHLNYLEANQWSLGIMILQMAVGQRRRGYFRESLESIISKNQNNQQLEKRVKQFSLDVIDFIEKERQCLTHVLQQNIYSILRLNNNQ